MNTRVCVCVFYLLAQRHATAQGTGESNDFGNKGLEGEVLLQHHSSEDGLHLWDPRPCRQCWAEILKDEEEEELIAQ